MTTQTTQSVFSGLKVVEIASFIAAPAAATMLSDFGADVIKVEPPGLGDPQRLLSSVPPSPAAPGNYSWHLANRNKRGMSVDLKSAGGTEILKRLVQWADVVITNFPHGTREALHLGYEEVSDWNPRVIYADITGFGDAGPDAGLPGFDLTAFWSRSGLLASTRDAGAPPTSPPWGSGDYTTATAVYAAITTALYHRERTGRGANVGTSLLATGVWATGTLVSAALAGGEPYELHDRNKPVNALTNPYQSGDDRWFMLAAKQSIWPALANAIGRSDLLDGSPLRRRQGHRPARRRVGQSAGRGIQFATAGALERGSRPNPRPLRRNPDPGGGGCGSATARGRHRRADRGRGGPGLHGQQPDHPPRAWPGCLLGAHPSTASTTTKSSHSWGSASMTSGQLREQKVIPAAPEQETVEMTTTEVSTELVAHRTSRRCPDDHHQSPGAEKRRQPRGRSPVGSRAG